MKRLLKIFMVVIIAITTGSSIGLVILVNRLITQENQAVGYAFNWTVPAMVVSDIQAQLNSSRVLAGDTEIKVPIVITSQPLNSVEGYYSPLTNRLVISGAIWQKLHEPEFNEIMFHELVHFCQARERGRIRLFWQAYESLNLKHDQRPQEIQANELKEKLLSKYAENQMWNRLQEQFFLASHGRPVDANSLRME